MYDLKNKCDFQNRNGHFINEYYPNENHQIPERISLIYEYYMKCDSIRFILTYNIKDTVELYEFKKFNLVELFRLIFSHTRGLITKISKILLKNETFPIII